MAENGQLTTEEAIGLEKSYWDAMQAKDGKRTSALSGKISLVAGSHGIMTIAKDEMAGMTEKGDWTLLSYEFQDFEVSLPIPHVAIIAYTVKQHVRIGGEDRDFRAADISTWVQKGNTWQCHAHSETILDDADAK